MPRYNPAIIEPKWQAYWDKNKTFATPAKPRRGQQKFYALDMFPYPSGSGLHVGHPEGYTATDIVSRAARMQGKAVMHPMGFDSFGLPAEEHAIKTGEHPRVQTEQNIDTFRRQLKMLGFSYDWDREIATTDVEYVRWTQWIFLQLYDTWFDHEQQRGRPIAELDIPDDVEEMGEDFARNWVDEQRLAYQSEAPVNWCPALGTVLANEEVIDGKSERGGHPVVRMPLQAVDAPHHGLRRTAGERPRRPRLVRGHQGAAAELDRKEHRGGGGLFYRSVRGSGVRYWGSQRPSGGYWLRECRVRNLAIDAR